MKMNQIKLIILLFGLLFVSCKNGKIIIGFLDSFTQGLSDAVALAVDQINESRNESINESGNDSRNESTNESTNESSLPYIHLNVLDASKPNATIELMMIYQNEVVGFIGPEQKRCSLETELASRINRLLISHQCAQTPASEYLVRMLPDSGQMVGALLAFLENFAWKRFVLIVAQDDTNLRIKNELENRSAEYNLTISQTYSVDSSYSRMTEQLTRIVEKSCDETRVYVLLAGTLVSIDLTRHLHRIRPDVFGEYAVVSLDYDIVYSSTDEQNNFNSLIEEKNVGLPLYNAIAVITPAPGTSPDFDDFCERFANRTQSSEEIKETKSPSRHNVFAALAYDAVMVYADALTRALENHENVTDGRQVVKHIVNRAYRSALGLDVRLDSNGSAEGHYVVLSLQRPSNISRWKNQPFFANFKQVATFLNSNDSLAELPSLQFLNSSWQKRLQVKDDPDCGYEHEKCQSNLKLVLIAIVILVLILLLVGLCFLIRFLIMHAELEARHWRIDFNDVNVLAIDKNQDCHDVVKTIKRFKSDEKNLFESGKQQQKQKSLEGKDGIGFYKGDTVFIKKLKKRITDEKSPFYKELLQLIKIRNEHINPFIGMAIETKHIYLLSNFCSRGSLDDILRNEEVVLDKFFVASFIKDLIKGLSYLHYTEKISHGNLKSSNCLVDSRFVLKIGDFGLDELRAMNLSKTEISKPMKAALLWKPPEVLRKVKLEPGLFSPNSNIILKDKSFALRCKADIYSLGFVLYEIVGRKGPWGDLLDSSEVISEPSYFRDSTIGKIKIDHPLVQMLQSSKEDIKTGERKKKNSKTNLKQAAGTKEKRKSAKQSLPTGMVTKKASKTSNERLKVDEIIERVKQDSSTSHFRPDTTTLVDCSSSLLKCIQACWQEQPNSRPTLQLVNRQLRKLFVGLDSNLVDHITLMLERYSNNLEEIVATRTKELEQEKQRSEDLLLKILPKRISDQLKVGSYVRAEEFDSVSIYFSDIVDFTKMASKMSIHEVVDFLSDLYSLFDTITESYNVYKIDTFGDAYEIVSGINSVVKEGSKRHHSVELALVAIKIFKSVRNFRMKGRSINEKVQLRAGIHSGRVAAGVIGHKQPKYCLFGDDVNIASRMESTGEALKIHISQNYRDLLIENGDLFETEYRGMTAVKGKDAMPTYWLLGLKAQLGEKRESKREEASKTKPKEASETKREEASEIKPEEASEAKPEEASETRPKERSAEKIRVQPVEKSENKLQDNDLKIVEDVKKPEDRELKSGEDSQLRSRSPSTETTPIQLSSVQQLESNLPTENAAQKIDSAELVTPVKSSSEGSPDSSNQST